MKNKKIQWFMNAIWFYEIFIDLGVIISLFNVLIGFFLINLSYIFISFSIFIILTFLMLSAWSNDSRPYPEIGPYGGKGE